MDPFPKGARVEKVTADTGDAHSIGARGTVAASVGPATAESAAPGTFGYWIDFDPDPERSNAKEPARVFVAGSKLRQI